MNSLKAVLILLLGMAVTSPALAMEAVIEDGKQVTINFTLKVEGAIVDSSEKSGPLEYEQGIPAILPPGLQEKLTGMKIGDTKQVTLSPEEGYGPVYAEAIVEVPKANLPEEGMHVGAVLSTQDENGQILTAIVKELGEETAKLDFNHPLAGKVLDFEIEIVSIA